MGLAQEGTEFLSVDFSNYPSFISIFYRNLHMPIVSCYSKNITLSGDTNSFQTRVATYIDAFGSQAPASLQNCKYIKKLQGNRYGCASCIHGYSGRVVPLSDLDSLNLSNQEYLLLGFFIDKCEAIKNCLSSQYYRGLGYG